MIQLKPRVKSSIVIASSNSKRTGRRVVIKSFPNLRLFGSKNRTKLVNIIS